MARERERASAKGKERELQQKGKRACTFGCIVTKRKERESLNINERNKGDSIEGKGNEV